MHSKVREARKTRIEDKSKNNMEERNFSKEPAPNTNRILHNRFSNNEDGARLLLKEQRGQPAKYLNDDPISIFSKNGAKCCAPHQQIRWIAFRFDLCRISLERHTFCYMIFTSRSIFLLNGKNGLEKIFHFSVEFINNSHD